MSVETDPTSPNAVSFVGYSRYDLLLAALPVPLLVGAALGAAGAISLTLGLWLGSLLSLPLLAYAVFLDPPV